MIPRPTAFTFEKVNFESFQSRQVEMKNGKKGEWLYFRKGLDYQESENSGQDYYPSKLFKIAFFC